MVASIDYNFVDTLNVVFVLLVEEKHSVLSVFVLELKKLVLM